MDQDSCDMLKQCAGNALNDQVNNLVMDMEKLDFLNSSGLNTLISILTRSRNQGGELVLANISPRVRELFIVTKLINVFVVKDSPEEAVKVFGEAETEN
jgi:anti-sigma B factor antagonist